MYQFYHKWSIFNILLYTLTSGECHKYINNKCFINVLDIKAFLFFLDNIYALFPMLWLSIFCF